MPVPRGTATKKVNPNVSESTPRKVYTELKKSEFDPVYDYAEYYKISMSEALRRLISMGLDQWPEEIPVAVRPTR